MSRTGSVCMPRRADSGYTLFELLVVLVLLAFIATLASPRLAGLVPGVSLDRAVTQISTQLRAARSDARRTSRHVTVALNAEEQSVQRDGNVVLRLTDARLSLAGQNATEIIVFYPDGSSSGGAFQLISGARARSLEVDWFNGEVTTDARPG